jgi:Tfp pilus assembly protein PilE
MPYLQFIPHMPEYLLVPIMIVVLAWGIGILILLISFRDYVRKTNKTIEKLYQELEKAPHDRETVQVPTADTLPEIDMDYRYW